jgi:protocatechuate 3,4-dioxygenase beta subunit
MGVPQAGNAPPPLPPTPTADLASLEGQVFDAIAGTPLRKATIVMNRSGGGRVPSGGRSTYSATSDTSGHYLITGIEPGTYRLNANHTGYLSMDYNARRPQGSGAPLDLGRGQKMTGAVFKLTPHGVITGKITDDDGDPLDNVNLQLMRWTYNNGTKQLQPAGNANTNDLGVYRMAGVVPGTYVLSAYRRNNMIPGDPAANQEDYVLTYFSGATDVSAAAPIEMAPGAQLDGINLRLSKIQTVRVRGHVVNNVASPAPVRPGGDDQLIVDGRPGNVQNPNAGITVRLAPRNAQMQMNLNLNAAAVRADGTFEFPSVGPGPYTLVAMTNRAGATHVAQRSLDVGHSNIDDANLSLNPGAAVVGTVRYDGDPPQPLPSLMVRLAARNPTMGIPLPQPAKVDPNGSFRFDDVSPELYTVNLNVPQNLYLKAVRSGTTDVLTSGMDVTNGGATLDILIGTNPPQVSGTVTNADAQQPAVAVTVVLIPEEKERKNQSYFYSVTTSDQYGNFTFNRVTPGEYKVYAWEDVQYGQWYDPDFMKAYEGKGDAVSAKEASPVAVKINMIPVK